MVFPGLLGGDLQLLDVKGLLQVVVGPFLDRLDRAVDGAMRRDDHHGQIRIESVQALEHLQAVVGLHAQVDEGQVESLPPGDLEGFLGPRCEGGGKTDRFQTDADGLENVQLVIDDQDPHCRRRAHRLLVKGSVK